jgi:hypothetical protein
MCNRCGEALKMVIALTNADLLHSRAARGEAGGAGGGGGGGDGEREGEGEGEKSEEERKRLEWDKTLFQVRMFCLMYMYMHDAAGSRDNV